MSQTNGKVDEKVFETTTKYIEMRLDSIDKKLEQIMSKQDEIVDQFTSKYTELDRRCVSLEKRVLSLEISLQTEEHLVAKRRANYALFISALMLVVTIISLVLQLR